MRNSLPYIALAFILCYLMQNVMPIVAYADSKGKMSVLSFAEDPLDMTANLQGTTVYDQNGYKCALIKIRTTERDFAFDTGMMGLMDVQYDIKNHPGEVWLYVPYGIKKLTIQHPLLGSVDYPITIQIQRAHTYVMELITDKVVTTIQKSLTSQYLIFNVNPADAVVILNKKVLKTENGCAWDYVRFGKYEWKVLAGEYYQSQSGTVVVSDANEAVIKNIELKPAFGTVKIPLSDISVKGASVYIDGAKAGTLPLDEVKLLEGKHEAIIVKDKFKTKTIEFNIVKGEECVLNADFEPDSCPVELVADYKARIFVDGIDCGLSSWKGDLASGVHIVTTSKENYKDSEQAIEIVPSKFSSRIRLESPVLRTGSINIDVYPHGSDVFIDGKKCGKTPYFQDVIAIGEHSVAVSNPDCHPYYTTVVVEEGKKTEVDAKMNQSVDVRLDSNAPGAVFTIDGKETNYSGNIAKMELGSHYLDVSAIGYRKRSTKVNVGKDTYSVNVRLKHKIDLSGGLGMIIGGSLGDGVISSKRSGAGTCLGLPGFFSIGTSHNFLNFRLNLTPSISMWETGDPLIFCPASVGARLRFGRSDINFFLEPEFGYNLMADGLSTPFFGGRTGMGCGLLDISFGYYMSCLDNSVYVGQIKPLYWYFGVIFNFYH